MMIGCDKVAEHSSADCRCVDFCNVFAVSLRRNERGTALRRVIRETPLRRLHLIRSFFPQEKRRTPAGATIQ